MESQNQHHKTKGQLDFPFLISNRGLDKKIRYLTIVINHEDKYQLEFKNLKTDYKKKDQLWYVERTAKKNYFKIKHDLSLNHINKDLYLTLAKDKENLQRGYFVELATLNEQDKESQSWTFDLGKNYTYCVKIPIKPEEFVCILPSEETKKTKVRCGSITHDKLDKKIRLQELRFTPLEEEESIYQTSTQIQLRVGGELSQIQHKIANRYKEIYNFTKSNFKGHIFQQYHPNYKSKIQQYATSSFPKNQMSPFLFAYPIDNDDIKTMLRYAKTINKKVVARSGGHQYSGLSSGGDGTIVISMNNFNCISENAKNWIEIGPCVSLKRLSDYLQSRHISIPHGQCPYVNIGGHAQTGGYGHIQHSFGLGIDYVQAFDIILADGTSKQVVRRQTDFVPKNIDEVHDIELFRGVLGGNAGSFGIVTKYYFNYIKDQDHPNCYGFSKVRYFNKELFDQTMKEIKKWTQEIASDKGKRLKGLEITLTIGYLRQSMGPIKQGHIMLLEGVFSNLDGKSHYKGQFNEIIQIFMQNQNKAQQQINKYKGFQKYDLSKICKQFVRKPPGITASGRQHDLPYKKRCNTTGFALSDNFLKKFSDQVNCAASFQNQSIFVIVQIALGGGAYYEKGQCKVNNDLTVTSIPHRDKIYFFSYDIFYDVKKDPNAEQKAEELQKNMETIVNKHYNSNDGGEKRFFWASFGDVDMTKQKVILMYYDSIEQYKKLQELKDRVDYDNLFNTPLTVKPTRISILRQ